MVIRCLSQESWGHEKNLISTKKWASREEAIKPRQPRGHAVYVQSRFTVFSRRRLQFRTSLYMCEVCWHITNTETHARTNTAKFYPSHLNCRARTPSRSTGAQSLTTDIILIAHRGRVVCPHSHPDSLCAENPTTENSGLRVSGGLWTAVSVRRVSP